MVLTTVVLKSHSCHFTLQFKLPDPLQSPYMDPFFKQRSRQSSADSQEGSSITYLQLGSTSCIILSSATINFIYLVLSKLTI
ncbi:hypothetical protein HanRHA438_Chr12g0551391 [Helianthus annuus]|uniref:Uncharacterized protein n=1 Tax=Helianthus annuus TaxID=4232 RepID=A0A9K3HGF6_HELAN|nr:hypothetical protein HanXRQr2_Chr12g0540591 [Helianthus annuus]KAJ0493104.1 hypothetical protein HanIR_Chr12g0582311 [Helianthus annuus]KAJ0725488.1 hypothetical protein HanPI659440_Chr12g0459321 [Helianthus annuus]KAJ0862619.1 hypothetical protein HanPSC8_Chr12g0520341 [Helianthus annuus]KAJ0866407.1 hypothetical protein HanRHA438_Chr12g0551391 [Helianthus annuus]